MFSSSFQNNYTYSISSLVFDAQQRCLAPKTGWKPDAWTEEEDVSVVWRKRRSHTVAAAREGEARVRSLQGASPRDDILHSSWSPEVSTREGRQPQEQADPSPRVPYSRLGPCELGAAVSSQACDGERWYDQGESDAICHVERHPRRPHAVVFKTSGFIIFRDVTASSTYRPRRERLR